jgi:hypothetical protein
VNKFVVEFAAIGFKSLERAILEAERRFCGSQTEELNHNNATLNDKEKRAMFLDLKTLPCSNAKKEVRTRWICHKRLMSNSASIVCHMTGNKTAAPAAKASDHVAFVVAEKKGFASATPHAKSSHARLQGAQESINDVEKASYDP